MNCQKYIEKIANIAKITNSTRIANCRKTLLQMFVAILAKIDLIEIACKNLVFESAKIAKVTRNFITPKNTQNTNSKNNNVYSKQIRLTKKKVLKTLKRKLENFAKIEKLTRIIYQFFIAIQKEH